MRPAATWAACQVNGLRISSVSSFAYLAASNDQHLLVAHLPGQDQGASALNTGVFFAGHLLSFECRENVRAVYPQACWIRCEA